MPPKRKDVQVVVFIGPEGVGKKEHPRRLYHRIGREKSLLVETAEVLREQNNRQINHQVRSRELVPDTQVNRAVGRYVQRNVKHVVILEGFPRTEEQARFLSEEGPALLGVENVFIIDLSPNSAARARIAPVIAHLTSAGAMHLAIKPGNTVEDTHYAIKESILPLLGITRHAQVPQRY